MTERTLELLNFSPSNNTDLLILDIGCGSGISGSVLTEYGHQWVGIDISRSMLG
jgi:18S rRNA (guanine1575-N7)-methyltransferase